MPKVDPRTLSIFWVVKLVCHPWGQGLEYPLCWHETSGLVAVGKQCLSHHLGKTVGWSHTNTTDNQRLVHVVKWQHQESRVPSVVWMWLAESLYSFTNTSPGEEDDILKWWNVLIPTIFLIRVANKSVQLYVGTTVLPSSLDTNRAKVHSAEVLATRAMDCRPPSFVHL